jgi:signal transduction histidine kinase
MTLVSLCVATFVYTQVRSDLRSEVDMGLRARAQVLIASHDLPNQLAQSSGGLADNDESFAQLLSSDGHILRATRSVANTPLLTPSALAHRRAWFHDRTPPGLETARLLEVPTTVDGERAYLIVGATLSDTREALTRLLLLFAVALPAALLVSSLIGWLLAGAALRPVRRMSSEAAAISDTEPERRLAVPRGDPGLATLASTVNATFDRLQNAIRRERTFSANASHELRTPLTILKAEVDSALSSPRSQQELRDALVSAEAEIRHLIAIAEGLLVIARTSDGRVPVTRTPTPLASLIAERVQAYSQVAQDNRIEMVEHADDVIADLDPVRLRQAIDNLLDNALRHCPTGGRITISARATADTVSIAVEDTGPGFCETALAAAFQPFNQGSGNASGAGLGLALANAVARAHHGGADARNSPAGGAVVTLWFRVHEGVGLDNASAGRRAGSPTPRR